MSSASQPSVGSNPAPFAGPGGVKVSVEPTRPGAVTCGVSSSPPLPAASRTSTRRAPDDTEPTTMMFSTLGLPAPLVQAARAAGLNDPTPIQAEALAVIRQGNDVIGNAPSGSGKTGAFLIRSFPCRMTGMALA